MVVKLTIDQVASIHNRLENLEKLVEELQNIVLVLQKDNQNLQDKVVELYGPRV